MSLQPGSRGEMEHRWLDHAWEVVNTDTLRAVHFMECQGKRGPVDDRIAGGGLVRWPGAVGSTYEPGQGVLFVGSVHREFHVPRRKHEPDLSILVEQERRLVRANLGWRAAGRSADSDTHYLQETTSAYEHSIPLWPRGGIVTRLARLLGDLPPGATKVTNWAWSNFAKCQSVPGTAKEADLRRACQSPRAFPIGQAIDILRPVAIVVAGIGVVEHRTRTGTVERADGTVLRGAEHVPAVFAFDGRNYLDATRRRLAVWEIDLLTRINDQRAAASQ